jgi:hypothetical protein
MRRLTVSAPFVPRSLAIAVLAAVLAGCVTVNRVPPDPTPTPAPTAAPTPHASASGPGGSPGASGPTTVVDASLLGHLPAAVLGFPLAPDPATAATVAADPTLAANAEAIAMAIVVAPGGSSGDDLAVASVVKLRPGVDNPIFRSIFRAAYDRVACEQAGGVSGSQSTTIAGREVLVGSCTGGATTYHVHLGDGLMVSVTSLGSRKLGEQIVADLQE